MFTYTQIEQIAGKRNYSARQLTKWAQNAKWHSVRKYSERDKLMARGLAYRYLIYLRDNGRCQYCKKSVTLGNGATLDHVIPRCADGSNDHTNLVTCCTNCNEQKNSMALYDYCLAYHDMATYICVKQQLQKRLPDYAS